MDHHINKVGMIEVSTCYTWDHGWETCLFHDNGDSEVIQNYSHPSEAKRGHAYIVAQLVLGAKLASFQKEPSEAS